MSPSSYWSAPVPGLSFASLSAGKVHAPSGGVLRNLGPRVWLCAASCLPLCLLACDRDGQAPALSPAEAEAVALIAAAEALDELDAAEAAKAAEAEAAQADAGTESDSDADFLKDVAKRGAGRAVFTATVEELPRLFAQEAITVARTMSANR